MKLGNCVTAIRGVSYKPGDLRQKLDGDSIVLLRANNITAGKVNHKDVQYVDRAKVKEKQLLHRGDILVCASSGSKKLVGKAALVKDDACKTFGAFCLVLRPNGLVEPEYLGHYFQSPQYRKAIEEVCTGSNINNLKPANFSELDVRIPVKSAQETAIKQMNGVQERMAECQRLQKQLDELVKSRFVEMFGDPFSNPLGFPEKKLGDLLEIARGGSPRPIKEFITDSEDGVNWIKIGDAEEGSRYITHVSERIKPEGAKKSREVFKGDFLLSNSMSFGRPYILDVDGCIHDGWLVLRDADGRFDKIFLCELLGSSGLMAKFLHSARGGVVNNLNKDLVGDTVVPVPPLALQQEFAAFVQQVDKSKFAVQQAIDKLQMLYDSLAQEYFGG